jgi:hypothetical protein
MDRRQFLIASARAGAVVGLASVADACASNAPLPPATTQPQAAVSVGRTTPLGPPVAVPPAPRPRPNVVAGENRLSGDARWDPGSEPGRPIAEGFLSATSAAPGDQLDLHLASPVDVDVDWYRLGWYGGLGGRLVRSDRRVPAAPAGPPAIDATTGRIEATGGRILTIRVDPGWPSGAYVAILRPLDGSPPGAAPFTVLPAPSAPRAGVLFVQASTTSQAYNLWGGADLYGGPKGIVVSGEHGRRVRRAIQVSFDRPYLVRRGLGLMPRWELNFIRWQEREDRDADYCADVDLELRPDLAKGRRLILFVGHHEYWSRPMRATLETAIAAGTNVAFLSADQLAWQVRFEASPVGAGRRVVCWKSRTRDPITTTAPALTTCRWREPPLDDPEATVVGQMYGHVVARVADWVVANAGHWLYDGTGLRDGDRITNLVGQEYDTFYPSLAPPGTTILARSPVEAKLQAETAAAVPNQQPLDERVHTATLYTAESGATVFAAGTFQWSWALDPIGDRSWRGVVTPLDPRVARMTRNLLDRLG